jgi:hypothetical protein
MNDEDGECETNSPKTYFDVNMQLPNRRSFVLAPNAVEVDSGDSLTFEVSLYDPENVVDVTQDLLFDEDVLELVDFEEGDDWANDGVLGTYTFSVKDDLDALESYVILDAQATDADGLCSNNIPYVFFAVNGKELSDAADGPDIFGVDGVRRNNDGQSLETVIRAVPIPSPSPTPSPTPTPTPTPTPSPSFSALSGGSRLSQSSGLNREELSQTQSLVSTQVGGVNIDVSLLYDGAYHEKILLPGNRLTAQAAASNDSGEGKNIQILLAVYDESGRLISASTNSREIEDGGAETFGATLRVPFEIEDGSAKIMIWNGETSPYTEPVLITVESGDYFGDDYSVSQPLAGAMSAFGRIHSLDDVDVFELTPLKGGLYVFESYGETDVSASLFAHGNLTSPVAADVNGGSFRLTATLAAGQKYYLYVSGGALGDYSLKALYAIGNLFGTVSPVKYNDNDNRFNEAIEAKVTLSTYDANEFVAATHLAEWSEASGVYAPFDMTGVHGGTYLASITRPGYLTWRKKVVLNDNVVDLGSVTLLAGDVNGDGIINAADSTLLQSLYNKNYGAAGYNIAADLNGDKLIDSADLALLTPNLGKNSNIYGQNVNCLTLDVSSSGAARTISGTAAANSAVTVNVYQGNNGVFTETVTANASGQYQTTCALTKTGTYTVVASATNRAFDAAKTINY